MACRWWGALGLLLFIFLGLLGMLGRGVAAQQANRPPTAVDDTVSTTENTPVRIAVLDNDSDPNGDELSVAQVEQPAHGTTERGGDNIITYTPEPDFNGTDRFTYVICDDGSPRFCHHGLVAVTVIGIDDPPQIRPDVAATDPGTPVEIPVLDNDTDPEADSLTVVSIEAEPANGIATINEAGDAIRYTPEEEFAGTDEFSYMACDPADLCGVATVAITVNPPSEENRPPGTEDDAATTQEGTPVTVAVLANDTDPDGDALTVAELDPPAHGSNSINPDDTVIYTPDETFDGTDTFTYKACDDGTPQLCRHGQVVITVNAVNHPPRAKDDVTTTDAGTSVTVPVLRNDTDPNGDPLTVTEVGTPANGTAAINPDDTITYTPNAGFGGTDRFTYTVCDRENQCTTAAVTVTVNQALATPTPPAPEPPPVNGPPTARADRAATDEDVPVTIAVLANDVDPDGDALTILDVTPPQHGTAISLNGVTVNYVPNPNFHGQDRFSYVVCDPAGLCGTAEVSVTVHPVNDPPVANDDTATTDEDSAVAITLACSDVDGDLLTFRIERGPDHGSLSGTGPSLSYTPDTNFNGSDSFTFKCNDGRVDSNAATVTITVNSVNDTPTVEDQSFTVNENSANGTSVGTVTASDPDGGDVLSYEVAGGNTNGAFAIDSSSGELSVDNSAALDYESTSTFVLIVQVTDSGGLSDTATVTISLNDVNEAPICTPVSLSIDEDSSGSTEPICSDPEGDALALSIVEQPAKGSASASVGTLSFDPNGEYETLGQGESDTSSGDFSYRASDGALESNVALVDVTVTGVNDPPVANDDSYILSQGAPLAVTTPGVLGNDDDIDGGTLSALLESGPEHGSLTLSPNGSFIYEPTSGFSGIDRFTYRANDGFAGSEPATVSITVHAVNRPPTAQDDFFTTQEDTPATLAVLANDVDPDGDPLEILSHTQGAHGEVECASGQCTYTPNDDWFGADTFTYTVGDGRGGTATAAVHVTVIETYCDADPVADPSLEVAWSPPSVSGQTATAVLSVTNTGTDDWAMSVIVKVTVLKDEAGLTGVTPSLPHDWAVGNLAPGGTKTLTVQLVASGDGEVKLQAIVTQEGCRSDHNVGRRDRVEIEFQGDDGEEDNQDDHEDDEEEG